MAVLGFTGISLMLLVTLCQGAPTDVQEGTAYYNFYDELAQSICTAAAEGPSFVFAIRRDCRSSAVERTCDDICTSRRDAMRATVYNQGSTSACFDAVHVYKNRPVLAANPGVQTDAEEVGLATYRYFSAGCSAKFCGPNYCCCVVR
ncbi:uncharacterized protein LOC118426025 [Branchiostoma floridae]|uniref:Uncharacterized protein LOC118426025 n=1 Tax=Branchiostoma floridae TaxID=7739 RepID=A0A9J7LY71_BRAFL|nr:uncharacterized protein LOC118426025 [Branchiostoma floridae]